MHYSKKFSFKPEEFLVEEITRDGTILELNKKINLGKNESEGLEKNYFTHFVLQKRNWNTMQALAAIASRLHVKPKRFDFAGTKDRSAVTTQLCSAFAIPPERLLSVNVKDLEINGVWKASEKIKLGYLLGNRFTITLTKENCSLEPEANAIQKKLEQNNFFAPNYFGRQRFGSVRENTALVGELLVKKDFEGAVMNYLCFADEKEGEDTANARSQLAVEKNFTEALQYYPHYLKYERLLLEHLAKNPRDFTGALQKLPRNLQLLFVHALQSRLFNETLSLKLSEKSHATTHGNVVGYESKLDALEQEVLKKYGLQEKDFLFEKAMPWLSMKGTTRNLLTQVKNFRLMEEQPLKISFELEKGCYATTVLEFLLAAPKESVENKAKPQAK